MERGCKEQIEIVDTPIRWNQRYKEHLRNVLGQLLHQVKDLQKDAVKTEKAQNQSSSIKK